MNISDFEKKVECGYLVMTPKGIGSVEYYDLDKPSIVGIKLGGITNMKSYLDWIINTDVKDRQVVVARVYCKDGESVSVQAGHTMYCSPKTDFAPWKNVECGYPSCIPPESWKDYSEEPWTLSHKARIEQTIQLLYTRQRIYWKYIEKKDLLRAIKYAFDNIKEEAHQLLQPIACNTIYPFLPIKLVKQFIKEHGGEDSKTSWDKQFIRISYQEVK